MTSALRRTAALLAGLAISAAHAAPIGQRPDSRHAAYPTAPPLQPPRPVSFRPVWEAELPGEPVVWIGATGGAALAVTAGGGLIGFDLATGERLWSAEGLDPEAAPVAGEGRVWAVGRDGRLRVHEAFSGRPLPSPLSSPVGRLEETGGHSAEGSALLAAIAPDGRVLSLLASQRPPGAPLETRAAPAPLRDGPVAALSRSGPSLWAALESGAEDAEGSGSLGVLSPDGRFRAVRPLPAGSRVTAIGQDAGRPAARWLALAMPGGRLELLDARRERRRWRVRTGTDVGAPPIAVTTLPGRFSKARAERLVVAATMDGLLAGYRLDNGHLAWTGRAAGRVSRPAVLWSDPDDPGPDRSRIVLAAEGFRRLEAFRGLDGAPAGALILQPESASILAGPMLAAPPGGAETLCLIAWSPFAPAGSRLLALRPGSPGPDGERGPASTEPARK